MSRIALVTLLTLAAALPAAAAPAGFAFLEVPAGARASALGGAIVSRADGIEAALGNPAGLAAVRGIEVAGSHYEFLEGLRHDQFAVAGQALGGACAASLRALYSGPIDARDELGNLTGTFGGHDLEFGAAYGRSLPAGVRAGLSAQLVHERIADQSATTWSLGAGASWEPAAAPALRLGVALDHLGPDARYRFADGPGQPVPLPTAVQAGATWHSDLGGTLRLASSLEARMTRGRATVTMLGGELAHAGGTALRLGLRVNDDTSTLSVGAGVALAALRLDYAFVPYRLDLGDTHRVSFSARL